MPKAQRSRSADDADLRGLTIPPELAKQLRCPQCTSPLRFLSEPLGGRTARCRNAVEPHEYPVMDGVPILLDPKRSVFDQPVAGRVKTDGGAQPGGALTHGDVSSERRGSGRDGVSAGSDLSASGGERAGLETCPTSGSVDGSGDSSAFHDERAGAVAAEAFSADGRAEDYAAGTTGRGAAEHDRVGADERIHRSAPPSTTSSIVTPSGIRARQPIVPLASDRPLVAQSMPPLPSEAGAIRGAAHATPGTAPLSFSERLKRRLPSLGTNRDAKRNYRRFAELLLSTPARPKVLVLGGAGLGAGLEAIIDIASIEFVESDVYLGPRTSLVCDAHWIPFEDGTFDGVIAQAVIEHVADPQACAAEIHRVLKPRGLVYADTPFMQQVHAGAYDFTRFTHLGQRRLFRKFDEVSSGPTCGPGMALAWAYQYFLLSFVRGPRARAAAIAFARLTAFWLKWFDRRLLASPGAFDAASAYYFMGTKSDRVLSDRELITQYRGLQQADEQLQ